ncbi:hypothetical protein BpHYR1_015278 [Brachionus plicatilis]|uniref:Uncharacterized protein n=1 Tax=Brachionus plicatilis TaxID=10195 RepID=A0A3M7Q733_BRAPC|nr:hypothetical protein BpHYR1_015278 [Brachionus plicatilis]
MHNKKKHIYVAIFLGKTPKFFEIKSINLILENFSFVVKDFITVETQIFYISIKINLKKALALKVTWKFDLELKQNSK